MKEVSLIIYPAADLRTAKQFFGELTGTAPYVDSAQYVGYKSGEIEIGLIPNKDQRESAALAYWAVNDIAASLEGLIAAGGAVVQPVTDVGYGLLVAQVKDPNGATVGLRQSPKG